MDDRDIVTELAQAARVGGWLPSGGSRSGAAPKGRVASMSRRQAGRQVVQRACRSTSKPGARAQEGYAPNVGYRLAAPSPDSRRGGSVDAGPPGRRRRRDGRSDPLDVGKPSWKELRDGARMTTRIRHRQGPTDLVTRRPSATDFPLSRRRRREDGQQKDRRARSS